ncbi:hypothetical protein, partial [Flavobacterium longum]|uniref:hypothetical protein n=1 Tax=Flavobacterium longum TaxID=1299340 RepID=UPI0039E8D461
NNETENSRSSSLLMDGREPEAQAQLVEANLFWTPSAPFPLHSQWIAPDGHMRMRDTQIINY